MSRLVVANQKAHENVIWIRHKPTGNGRSLSLLHSQPLGKLKLQPSIKVYFRVLSIHGCICGVFYIYIVELRFSMRPPFIRIKEQVGEVDSGYP
jgi:hypothetical protein